MVPGIDHLESRQLLSTAALPAHGPLPAHHHHPMRLHHAAVVGRVQSGHHGGADPAATVTASATLTSFQVVAQFANASFSGTAAIADNDIWAVGDSTSTGTQEPLAVHFNGSSWSVVPTPSVKGGPLTGVAAVASNDVWAVGSTGSQSLIEHWDGTSWSAVWSPTPSGGGSLTAVTAISSTDVWAVGIQSQFSGDVVEHWNGTSWSLFSSPAFTGASDILRGISADASKDVWAVGDSFSVGGAVILHFDGSNWSRVAAPSVDRSLLAVTVLSSTNAWAAGGAKGRPPSDTEAGVAAVERHELELRLQPEPEPPGHQLTVRDRGRLCQEHLCRRFGHRALGWHELEHPHHPERSLRHGRRDGFQRWDRRDRQLERRHPGELRAPLSARPRAGPKRSSPLRCVCASPRFRSGIAILAVTDAIPVLAVIRAFPVILGAVLCPTLRLRAVLRACRASPSPLLDAACAEK